MKELTLWLSILLCATSVQAQTPDTSWFEGEVYYTQKTYESNVEGKIVPSTEDSKEVNHLVYYGKGKLLQLNEELAGQYQFYNAEDSALYIKHSLLGDTTYQLDPQAVTDTILSIEVFINADTLLGYPCNKVKVRKNEYIAEYTYPTDAFKIDPTLFSQHKTHNYDSIYQHVKGVYLKYKVWYYEGFGFELVAYRVKERPLPESYFTLVPTAYTKRSTMEETYSAASRLLGY